MTEKPAPADQPPPADQAKPADQTKPDGKPDASAPPPPPPELALPAEDRLCLAMGRLIRQVEHGADERAAMIGMMREAKAEMDAMRAEIAKLKKPAAEAAGEATPATPPADPPAAESAPEPKADAAPPPAP